MKRIKAECLEQTLHFTRKGGLEPEAARKQARQEYEAYKASWTAPLLVQYLFFKQPP